MDLDRFVATHRPDWERLRQLTRLSHLTGAEADEFVELYGRASTDLSIVRSEAPDPALVAELSTLVARARGTTTGTRRFTTDDISRYFVGNHAILLTKFNGIAPVGINNTAQIILYACKKWLSWHSLGCRSHSPH